MPVAPWSNGPVETIEEAPRARGAHRLPADDQGRRGRRRARHPQGARGVRARARADHVAPRGRRRVRRRHRLHGGDGRQRAPHRGAADRRRPGRGVGRGRARLLLPAPPPEGHRGVVQRRPHAASRRKRSRRRRGASRSQSGYRNAGTVEFLYEPEEQALLLHGGQRAPAGRAPGHRGGHRTRSRQAAAARGRRRPPGRHAARAGRPRHRGAPERRGSRDGLRAHAGPVQVLDLASGPGIRVDRGIAAGDVIPPDFDSMVAKVIAYGRTRARGDRPAASARCASRPR